MWIFGGVSVILKSEKHQMKEIIINKSYTTQKDIENCIKAFYELPKENSHLQIRFTEQINEIDILLIAYLILFKEIKPNLKITVRLNFDVDNDLKSKLYQYLIYAFLMTGKSVFTIINSNEYQGEFSINENSLLGLFQKYFTLSESFMPILLVGKLPDNNGIDLYSLLFKEKVEGLKEIPQNVDFNDNDKLQYQNLNRWIKGYLNKEDQWIPGIINPYKRLECISYLSRLAFYNSLRQAKITRFYLYNDEETWKSLQIDDIPYAQNKDGKYPQIEFFKEIKWIFDDLSNCPPLYHFIYSQLLSSKLLPGAFNSKNKEKIINILHSLWHYTKDMVDGINELAKNIREHANPPIGVITGRIYKEEKWLELKKGVEGADNIFDGYLSSLKENVKSGTGFSFFDFNVADLGEKGIIETLKEKTEELVDAKYSNGPVKDLFSEDLETLNNCEIKLKHFLNPSLGNTLNQQSKKAIAHLGLLIFSNLIKENKGILRAGTKDNETFLTYLDNSSKDANTVPFGTNYHVVLPISAEREIETLLPHPLNIPLESALIEIMGIEELLNYELINLNGNETSTSNAFPENTKYLYRICIDSMELTNKDKEIELWNSVNSIMTKYYDKADKKNNFFCVDLENVKINESQLFRFLGTWNLHYPKTNLIVTNITTDIFNELIKINEYFLKRIRNSSPNDDAIYWNENSMMLIYSYCEPRQNEERFYFTDVLWGKEKQDFYHINKLIKKTNFNATTIFLQKLNDQGYDDNKLALIIQSGFFHSRTTLLPFDLLLPGKNELTLFEHNASVLLQNELKLQENNSGNNE